MGADITSIWRPDDKAKPKPHEPGQRSIYRPDILEVIEKRIGELDEELRELSIQIHDHPELGFKEKYAHDVLTAFVEKHGFKVERHFHLETAWKATFTYGAPGDGRTIGVNSEMDALPGIGHACGHNLIAISGVAVACAIKAAFEEFKIPGTVCLLGTPAEEGGSGKLVLLKNGAYADMAACLMSHPAPGPIGSVSLSSCLAVTRIEVEYIGHTAHAALSPWEGNNAQDAAVLAYNNISALRQQIRPTHRVHAIIENQNWAVNIIPDRSKMICLVRTPTSAELEGTVKKVTPCFEAAALATGCQFKLEFVGDPLDDLRQNEALGGNVAEVVLDRYGAIDYEWGIKSASTDFGNVTYTLPALHPGFAIPTVLNGGNHTPEFEQAAATIKAHYACLDVSKALAATGVRVVLDDKFNEEVKQAFEEDKKRRGLKA